MVLEKQGRPLVFRKMPVPEARGDDCLIRVEACGICRTDLHILDADLKEPNLPLIPGHQVVGRIVDGDSDDSAGLVGVPWLGGSCGRCRYCRSHRENLCDHAVYTGYQRNGGFAGYCVADSRYCFPIPGGFTAVQAAPLLCAGLIGYRSWRPVRSAEVLGLYGFGAAAHILVQVAKHQGQEVYAFTRTGDECAQSLARRLGADWVGDSSSRPPKQMDAAIIFAPVGDLVLIALQNLRKGGQVICAGIHMSDLPPIPYAALWGERSVASIANLTRRDGEEFFPLAASIPIRTEVHEYPLARCNEALDDLRHGRFAGAAVIVPPGSGE